MVITFVFCFKVFLNVFHVFEVSISNIFHVKATVKVNSKENLFILRLIHEGEHSAWSYETILGLSHLFQVKLLLFSARAFSKLYFLFSLTLYFKTYSNSVSAYNKITIIYEKEI